MSNSYFQFKQFTVHQDKCAMKVCTDACLFGAWITDKMQNENCNNILDIGTGTGLLSLMLAQKTTAIIDAVEVDEQTASQAEENFKTSPWKQLLSVHHTSIQKFVSDKKYDLIISNPPFFEQSLRSENREKNIAKHGIDLSLSELAEIVATLLSNDGKFCLLLPYSGFENFKSIALEKQLHCICKADVQQTPKHSFFRSMGIFSKDVHTNMISENLVIKDDQDQYTNQFKELLKDYCLYL